MTRLTPAFFLLQGVTLTDLQEAEKTMGRGRATRTREEEKEDEEKQDKEKQQEERKEMETKEEDYRSRYRSLEEVGVQASPNPLWDRPLPPGLTEVLNRQPQIGAVAKPQ